MSITSSLTSNLQDVAEIAESFLADINDGEFQAINEEGDCPKCLKEIELISNQLLLKIQIFKDFYDQEKPLATDCLNDQYYSGPITIGMSGH